MPEPLSAWKYLLWTPALPSTQHRQLWELFKQGRSTDSRRLIWRDEGIRKWNLHWCTEGMEREIPLGPRLWPFAYLMGILSVKTCSICLTFICLDFLKFVIVFKGKSGRDFMHILHFFSCWRFVVTYSVYLQRCSCSLLAASRVLSPGTISSSLFLLVSVSLSFSFWRTLLHLAVEWHFSHQPQQREHTVFSGTETVLMTGCESRTENLAVWRGW